MTNNNKRQKPALKKGIDKKTLSEALRLREVKLVPLGKIKPYHRNNKRHTDSGVREMIESFKEFGVNGFIVLDEKMTVLAGHRRYEAFRRYYSEIGKNWKTESAPAIIANDLSSAQKIAYRLADNKFGMDTEIDIENYDLEAAELHKLGFDTEPFGMHYEPPVLHEPDPVEHVEFDAVKSIKPESIAKIPFEAMVQRTAWDDFVRFLSLLYPEADSIGERIRLFVSDEIAPRLEDYEKDPGKKPESDNVKTSNKKRDRF